MTSAAPALALSPMAHVDSDLSSKVMQTLDNSKQLLTQPQQIKPEEVTGNETLKAPLDEGYTAPENQISLDEGYTVPENQISLDEGYTVSENQISLDGGHTVPENQISLDQGCTASNISLDGGTTASNLSLSESMTHFANVAKGAASIGLGRVMQWFSPSDFEYVTSLFFINQACVVCAFISC